MQYSHSLSGRMSGQWHFSNFRISSGIAGFGCSPQRVLFLFARAPNQTDLLARVDSSGSTRWLAGQLLTRDLMEWFWDSYLGGTKPEDAKRARPLLSEGLAQLPPLLVVTAERDPLRDEGAALAQRCRDAGVPVDYRHYGDAEHGFACSEGETADFLAFMDQVNQWLEDLPAAGAAA